MPLPRPLRTGRESFPSPGSSVSKAVVNEPAHKANAMWTARYGTEARSLPGKGAPAEPAAVICNPFFTGSSVALVPRRLREVCPLSRGVLFQPLSLPLRDGLCFLPHPLPASPSVGLTALLPQRGTLRAYRVPLEGPDRFRFSLCADGVLCPCQGTEEPLDPPYCLFGASLTASSACC